MLRITTTEESESLDLRLEGKLSGPWVEELSELWAQLRTRRGGRPVRVDLRALNFVDEEGRRLLQRLHQEGCELRGCSSCYVAPLIEEIRGRQEGFARPSILRALVAGALLLAGGRAFAQDAPAATRLSLKEALRIALAQSPQVKLANLSIARSQEESRAAKGALLPSLEADAQGTRLKYNVWAQFGEPIGFAPETIGPFNTGSVGLNAEMPLFDLSLWHRWKAARHGEEAAQAQELGAREQVTALVVAQYFSAQRAQASVKAAGARVELATALEKLAEDQQKAGVGTGIDTLRAKVELQNERQRLIQAQTQLKTSSYGLVRLLDLDPATDLELSDELAAPALPAFSFGEALQQGLAQRPELTALEAEKRGAESMQSSARSMRLPSVVLTGNYSTTGLQGQPWVPTYAVGVGVKVPLFTGSRISAQVAKAQLELDEVAQRKRELEARVGLEIRSSQAEMDAASHEVEVTSEAASLAQQELEQARHRFEAGVSSNIEVINAQNELAAAGDQQINALYRLNQARADLARAMGRLEPLFEN